MKITYRSLRMLSLAFATTALWSCQDEVEAPSVSETLGSVDVTTYISVGNSLTSGYADKGLYEESQKNSFPMMLANEFKAFGGGEFMQPTVKGSGSGYLKLELKDGNPTPVPVNADPSFAQKVSGKVHNFGIPGIRVIDVAQPTYKAANPYFARIDEADGTTYLQWVSKQEATFFTCWLGGNDVLGYATSGGAKGVDGEPNTYVDGLSPVSAFQAAYDGVITTLLAKNSGKAKGVIATIPDVTKIPFFTTVAPQLKAMLADENVVKQITMDEQTVGFANFVYTLAGFKLPEAGLFKVGVNYPVVVSGNMMVAKQEVKALDLDADYPLLTFSAVQNDILINKVGYVNMANVSAEEQQKLQGLAVQVGTLKAQATALAQQGKLVEAKAKQDEIVAIMGDSDNMALAKKVAIPLGSQYVLDATEAASVIARTKELNTIIEGVANSNDRIGLLDANALLDKVNNGLVENGVSVNGTFVKGGAFSLDGVHMTPRGYAVVANGFIDATNKAFGSRLGNVNIAKYNPVLLP
ncbi:outer membrane protein [Fulvitalea axinellae]|uniref:Outer membrane protein n=1 Tax=Fulvitalea axinellae TaxID=1182444 RepID=A0AAU9DA31_9BACT|nr:outer membrane protein [Fulvitalea axinellae]